MLTARRVFAVTAALALWLSGEPAAPARKPEPLKVLTIDPMMEQLLRFIGGPYVDVVCAQAWNSRDRLTVIRSRLMSAEAMRTPLIVLDDRQYAEFALRLRRRATEAERARPMRALFPDGTRSGTAARFYSDPANLPFTAQRAMNALAELLPKRFDYFQRRLGEFSARLRSVLISGRRRFSGARVLCLSDLYRPFFAASGALVDAPTPAESRRIRSLAGARTPEEGLSLAEPLRDGRLVVFDWQTEPETRRALAAYAGGVYLPPPRGGDLLFSIHSDILAMGSRLDQMK